MPSKLQKPTNNEEEKTTTTTALTKNKMNNSVLELFSRPIKPLEENINTSDFVELPDRNEDDLVLQGDENLSAFQIKERNDKTIFVGNIDLDLKANHIQKHFKDCGEIEKIWFRSLPVDKKGKMPQKAAAILKKYVEGASGKNAYILFKNKESVEKALNLNGTIIKTNHIRVDYAIKKNLDYTKTIFIGNVHFGANEEELRSFFKSCGGIENIRVIRDPNTHIGKGIAYITFKEEEGFKNSLNKNGQMFKERELRIKKAVPAKRLEKKKLKKENRNNALKRLRLQKKQALADDDMDTEDPPIRPEDIDKAIDNKELAEPEIDKINYANETSISKRVIRKKIKKIQSKKSPNINPLKIALKEKKKIKEKRDREIFDNVNEMEKRKEKRKKRRLQNMKKVRNENKRNQKDHQKKEKLNA